LPREATPIPRQSADRAKPERWLLAPGSTLSVAWQLGRRDLRARRRLSAVMLLRSLVQPLAQTGLFWLLLSGILRLRFENTRGGYPVFLLAGLLAWGFLSNVVAGAATCLSSNAGLVRRVALPREAIVYANAADALVQAGVVIVVLVMAVAFSPGSAPPASALLWLPPLIAVLILFSLGLALLSAVTSVLLPSTALGLPIILQAWFYATPIVYPPTKAPSWLGATFVWNPAAVLVAAFRGVLLEGVGPDPAALLYASGVAVATFLAGRWVFRRFDRLLPDLV
jgi:lipopolysaccharide transport system permease protein